MADATERKMPVLPPLTQRAMNLISLRKRLRDAQHAFDVQFAAADPSERAALQSAIDQGVA